MLDEKTISEVFGKFSRAGDGAAYLDPLKRSDGCIGWGIFKHTTEELIVYVYSDGTYACTLDRSWNFDMVEFADCVARAAQFVSELKLKRRG